MTIENCDLGEGTIVWDPSLVNLYRCTLGRQVSVAPFVEIQEGAIVGDHSHVCSHAFIAGGTQIGDRVFVGHGVGFVNDLFPVIGYPTRFRHAVVEDDVFIGTNATILPVTIGSKAMVGAGAVVTEDVPPMSIVAGNPARIIRQFENDADRLAYILRERE